MSTEPKNIEVGRCYLTPDSGVRRVLRLLPGDRVYYDGRPGAVT
jgi:hypothetical protein